ncbi:MAG: hypothetical protein M3Q78_03600, partial [Acidobacteriota bacterium]|nr:hypothetical protein [Acidobacteriota bacterium]
RRFVEIVRVKNEVSVARVKTSCDNLLLGDLVQSVPPHTSPLFEKRPALDLFGEPSGKASGRIVMARDNLDCSPANRLFILIWARKIMSKSEIG